MVVDEILGACPHSLTCYGLQISFEFDLFLMKPINFVEDK